MLIKPRPFSITIKLDKKEKNKLIKAAKEQGLSLSDYVRYKTIYGGK